MNEVATPQRSRRWPLVVAVALLAIVACVAALEIAGWPFLATPLQNLLSEKLNRRVVFSASAEPAAKPVAGARIRFIGGVRASAPQVMVAAPDWSTAPHLFVARDVELQMRYVDLWRAYRGEQLRVDSLTAAEVDGNMERLADGRTSWRFDPADATEAAAAKERPRTLFGKLQVASGTVRYRDEIFDTNVEIHLSLLDRDAAARAAAAPKAATGTVSKPAAEPTEKTREAPVGDSKAVTVQSGDTLRANATGKYRALPLKLEMISTGVLPWTTDEAHAVSMPMTMNATVGRAKFSFNGTATDFRRLSGFTGRFSLSGPSLAAAGEPLGVTLPTTPAFRTEGVIVRRAETWHVVIEDATVGASRLKGAFTYEAGRSPRLLSGRLGGSRLLLTDLGPAVGVTPNNAGKDKGKVLPARPFDLASLRSMDANVLLDFGELDLSSKLLEPLRPMRGHLKLAEGVLTLTDIDARTGEGKLKGDLSLDGRQASAIWNANLRWDGVQLERWIHQGRKDGAPPFVSGRLNGKTTLQGQGRSTAEILATLKGKFRTELIDGKVSHLVVEVAGLDLAEALGLVLTGDKTLPVQCGVVDLVAEDGVFRPRVMVLDTTDSAIWVDGSLSLATESLDLKAVVSPKDFSPLTLRTPLLVRGSFDNPKVSIEKGPLGRKIGTAFLLGLVNPLAALLPLFDTGDAREAKGASVGCQGLMQRSEAQRAAAARAR